MKNLVLLLFPLFIFVTQKGQAQRIDTYAGGGEIDYSQPFDQLSIRDGILSPSGYLYVTQPVTDDFFRPTNIRLNLRDQTIEFLPVAPPEILAIDELDFIYYVRDDRIYKMNAATGEEIHIAGNGETAPAIETPDAKDSPIMGFIQMVAGNGKLYFQDWNQIMSLNLNTGELDILITSTIKSCTNPAFLPFQFSIRQLFLDRTEDVLYLVGDDFAYSFNPDGGCINTDKSYGGFNIAKDWMGRFVYLEPDPEGRLIWVTDPTGGPDESYFGQFEIRKDLHQCDQFFLSETFDLRRVQSDDAGNLLISHGGRYLTYQTLAGDEFIGNGTTNFSGENILAENAALSAPISVVNDANGNLYFAEQSNGLIRKVDQDGIITTFVGREVPAVNESCALFPIDLSINPVNSYLYLSRGREVGDFQKFGLLEIGSEIISDVMYRDVVFDSNGAMYSSPFDETGVSKNGVPIPELLEYINEAWSLAFGGNTLYVLGSSVEDFKNIIVAYDAYSKKVTVLAGAHGRSPFKDGQPGSDFSISGGDITLSLDGDVFLASDNRIYRIETDTKRVFHVAGTGEVGFSGDGGDPQLAVFGGISDINFDKDGNLYVADLGNDRIRVITGLKPGEPPYTKRSIYRSASAGDQEVPDGLIFWNSMDSKEEVENSVWGPNIQQKTHQIPLWGEARIEPAKFGNGLYVNQGIGNENNGANFFAVNNHEMNMSVEHGTIEFLIKFDSDYSLVNYGHIFIMHQVLSGHFTNDEYNDRSGVKFQLVWNGGAQGGRYLMSAAHEFDWFNGWTGSNDNVNFEKGEIAHIAFVWDINGIDGTTKRAHLYINGILEATIDTPWPTAPGIRNYTYIGISPGTGDFDYWLNGPIATLDNFKIWNRPLSPDEFMDNAKTFEGFVEVPETVSVEEGEDTSPESLGYPKVWTLCEGEITYAYEDVDNGGSISRHWTVNTPCGEVAEVTQQIYLGTASVTNLVLVNPRTDQDFKVLKELDTWVLWDHWKPNIRADISTPDNVESVVFKVNGDIISVDNTQPYAIGPNNGGDYRNILLDQGVKTICATPYTQDNGEGEPGIKKCVTLTLYFTQPEETNGEGNIQSLPGSYLYGEVKPYGWYSFDARYDHMSREFSGSATFDFGGPDLTFMSTRIDHFFQRKDWNTLFWYGEIAGVDDYLMEQRFFYRKSFTRVRIKITKTSTGEIIYDSQRGEPPWAVPSIIASNDSHLFGDPIRAEIDGDWSLEEVNLELGVYPNPFIDKLNLSIPFMDVEYVRWTLTDLRGRLVLVEEAKSGGVTEIDVSELPQGVYILAIDAANEKHTFRVVK